MKSKQKSLYDQNKESLNIPKHGKFFFFAMFKNKDQTKINIKIIKLFYHTWRFSKENSEKDNS